MAISILLQGNRWAVAYQGKAICYVEPPEIAANAEARMDDGSSDSGVFIVSWENDSFRVHDSVKIKGSEGVCIKRRVENLEHEAKCVVVDLTAYRPGSPEYTIIPGVQYQGNHWGTGKEPKGFEHNGKPWRFTGTRTTLPGATVVEMEGLATGLFVSTSSLPSVAVSCSLEMAPGGIKQRLIWPWGEAPLTYVDRDSYGPPWEGNLTIPAMGAVELEAYLGISPSSERLHGWHGVFRQGWRILGSEVLPWHAPEEVRDLCRQWVQNYLVAQEGELTLFSIGLSLDEERKWVQRPVWRYEIGWCGQNASLAASMLEWSLESGDPEVWELGARVLDSWVAAGSLDNGLMLTHLDPILEGRAVYGLDTCNLGAAALQYLRAYDISKRAGKERVEWLKAGLGICGFFLEHGSEKGKFGKLWSVRGELLEGEGTIGCYLIPPLITAWRHTGDKRYLDRAVDEFWAYIDDDLKTLMIGAGALDTNCIDKESAFPLLRAANMLYEETADERYLIAAEHVGYYLITWMYHYDVPLSDTTVLGRMGYRTTGGTTVSAQHHHIDPWGALMAPEMIRLGQLTGDDYWHQVGVAMWNQSTIGIWDGKRECPDGIPRPSGSQDEGWCQTVWREPGETTKWLVAWPAAFHLEGWRFMCSLESDSTV